MANKIIDIDMEIMEREIEFHLDNRGCELFCLYNTPNMLNKHPTHVSGISKESAELSIYKLKKLC